MSNGHPYEDERIPEGMTVIPFTTHEGSGLASTVRDVKKTWPKAMVKDGFAIYGHEVRSGRAKVEKWSKGFGSSTILKRYVMEKRGGVKGKHWKSTFGSKRAVESKGEP